VAESAIIGFQQEVRGESPLAFITLKGAKGVATLSQKEKDTLEKEITEKVRKDIGAFARMEACIFIDCLPKTRSGKILRGTMKSICNGWCYK